MILTLTNEELEFLIQTMKRYLSDLRIEIARTDNRLFKVRLKHDEEIAHVLIQRLESIRG